MKNILGLFLFLIVEVSIFAQQGGVAIGTNTVNPRAILTLVGNNQGLIIPTVATLNTIGATLSDYGMIVYNSTDKNVYFFDGAAWKSIGTSTGGSGAVTSVTGISPISVLTGTTTPVVSISQASSSTNGYLLSTDWNTFNAKISLGGDLIGTAASPIVAKIQGVPVVPALPALNQILQFNGTSWVPTTIAGTAFGNLTSTTTGLTLTGGTGAVVGAGTTINIQNATTTQSGLLTGTDWNAFNNKLNNPLLANGDLIFGLTSTPARLPIGTNTQVLTVSGGLPTWQPAAGFANPMTTAGDIIFGGASGAPIKLGASTGFLKGGVVPAYSAVNLATADVAGTLAIASGGTGATTAGGALANIGAMSNALNSANIFVGNAGNVATGVVMSGDATLSNTGALTIANNSVSTAKILDATIADIDISNTAAIAGTKLVPSFGTQNISTTGTLSTGAATHTGLTISGSTTMINTKPYVWPNTVAGVGTVLTNDGTGTLSWASGGSGWGLTGNTGTNTATDFIGTTDAKPLRFGTGGLEKMLINTSGNVGIGTSTPLAKLDILGAASGIRLLSGAAGSSTSIGIGRTAIEGTLAIPATAGEYALNSFAGDIVLRTENTTSRLILNSGTTAVNGLIIDLNGVHGAASFDAPRIACGGSGGLALSVTQSPGGNGEQIYVNTVSSTDFVFLASSNVGSFVIQGNGLVGINRTPTVNTLEISGNASKTTAGSWLANSDRRIKTDIQNIDNSLELIKQLHPVKFKYTKEWMKRNPSIKDQYYYNFIAQEFQQVFPEAVQGSEEYFEGDKTEILQIDTYNAQIISVKAIQLLLQRIETLEIENEKLIDNNAKIKAEASAKGVIQEHEIEMLKRQMMEVRNLLGIEARKNK